MKRTQSGFTLIELVVVIVLLGILGVTALGKFQDLSTDAEIAAVSGVASEMSAAAAINFATSTLGNTPDVSISSNNADTVDTGAGEACTAANLTGLFQSDTFPSGFTLTANAVDECTASGVTYNCTVNSTNGQTAVATLICTGGA